MGASFYNWLNFIFNSDRFESNISKEIDVKAILNVPFITTETKKISYSSMLLLPGGDEVVFWLIQPEVEKIAREPCQTLMNMCNL